MSIEVKKEDIIQHGIETFRSLGAHYVCEVCIKVEILVVFHANIYKMELDVEKKYCLYSLVMWNSRFLFDQIGLLDEWNRFWSEIPGQMFRRDITPDKVRIRLFIDTKKLDSRAGERLAERLKSYVQQGGDIGELECHLSKTYSKY